MSITAASHLSPAYPLRAPWGVASALRAWQQEALDIYLRDQPRDFLAVATPGAGKTAFALRVATELLEAQRRAGRHRRRADRAPQAPVGRRGEQGRHHASTRRSATRPGAAASDYTGVAVTYAQVAAHPVLHRRRTETRKTLVILDEVHHGGDALSWGDAVREAFEPAARRLALTGTPFRSDTSAIPFVTYARGRDGVRRSAADYSYGYGRALADGVVRPVMFLSYSGQMRWRTRAGEELSATLGEPLTKDLTAHAWRTALDPSGNWIPQVLAAADRRLTEMRRGVPDAGGLVIATDQQTARAYAKQLKAITGEPATVVLSDEPGASARIEAFAAGDSRWMVAVRMVSEGVDIPRLAVGVYATSTATPLFFAQAVGRFLRARRRGETASVFLPSVPLLLQHAAEMEIERDHALDRVPGDDDNPFAAEDLLLAEANRAATEPGADDELEFEALEAEATFDRVLFDGGEFGTQAAVGSDEEADFLGLPGLLDAGPGRHPAARPAERAAGQPVTAYGVVGRAAVGTGRRRRRCTGRCRRCARSSTPSSAPGTTAPVCRTEPSTPSCGRPAAARWPRRRAWRRSRQRIDTIRRWAVSRRSR